jgi:hypothetical protein
MGMKSSMVFVMIFPWILSGCSVLEDFFKYKPSARQVSKSLAGGVISLKIEHQEEDKNLAEKMMNSHCSTGKFSIVSEGEVVVGSMTNQLTTVEAANKKKKKGLFGMTYTEGHDGALQSSSETIQKKEWHITYSCKT